MSVESIIWIVVPSLLAFIAAALSIYLIIAVRATFHRLLGVVCLALSLIASGMFYRIQALGAYPTFVPHIMVAVSMVTVIAQMKLSRSRRQRSRT